MLAFVLFWKCSGWKESGEGQAVFGGWKLSLGFLASLRLARAEWTAQHRCRALKCLGCVAGKGVGGRVSHLRISRASDGC